MIYKILVVDDESDLRELITTFLQLEGYDVETAVDGKDAFEKILKNRPDLVVSDIRMPNWDGFELMKQVSEITPPHLPILFISGYTDGRESVLKNGPNYAGFLAKPVMPNILIDKVRSIQSRI